MTDLPSTPAPILGPRIVSFSVLFLKSFAGLGIGILGTVILLIFVGLAGISSTSGITSPFFVFTALVMGLVVALATNSLSIVVFSVIDRKKYPPVRGVLWNVAVLNIAIFLFLLPMYAIAATSDIQTILMVVALDLILSAQASAFALELAASHQDRERMLAIYGVTFGMLLAVLANLGVYYLFAHFLQTGLATDMGQSTSSGVTALLFAVLPFTWFFFGFFTTMVEMTYRWMYETWGVDYLAEG